MRRLGTDLKFSLRRLAKSPRFALATVLILGLGIGVSVLMFSVLKGVVLSGLPYPGGDRVVAITATNTQQGDTNRGLTLAEAVHLSASRDSGFEAFGYYRWDGMTVIDGGRPREIRVAMVSADYFTALGLPPALGRTVDTSDVDSAEVALVLSHGEWQRLTGGDPGAVGDLIETVEHGRVRLVGVMPPEFDYPSPTISAWLPFPRDATASDGPGYLEARYIDAVGRIGAGTSPSLALERAQASIDRMQEQHGLPDDSWRIQTTPLLEEAVGDADRLLWASFGVAVLVLLIACANAAILLHARQLATRHEQAIAQAIGASPARLFRVLLIQLGLLGIIGAAFGVGLAAFGLELLRELAAGSVPRADDIALDAGVVIFALSVGLATPLLVVLMGAPRSGSQPIDAMRGCGKGAVTTQTARTRFIPVLGLALSTTALLVAAAMVASLTRIREADPGFRTENVQVLQLGRTGDSQAWARFADEMLTRLKALPGVSDVAVSTAAPLSGLGTQWLDVSVPGRADADPLPARLTRISPSYLDLLSIPVFSGRNFDETDRPGSERVAIVNHTFARQAFGDEPAIGKLLTLSIGDAARLEYRIIGISEDTRNGGLRNITSAEVMVPFLQEPWIAMSFLVRTETSLPGIAAQMRETLWAVDPNEGVTREFAMDDQLQTQLRPARFFARTVTGFALSALLLAGLGVYAVATQHQQQRQAEFGLRQAIGAPPARLAGHSLGKSFLSAGLGLALGMIGGWLMLRLIQTQLFEFGGDYLPWFAGVMAGIALTVLAAALPPAIRVARTSPMTALRHE